ncbi:MAG: hypothetical protein PUI87_00780 [Mycoplasmataceae bacterium]|nr:hypothetical protein [Mycoplasmataceae bacterium]MDD7685699.1 hypothetical protein [Mycoplasmataceae bacterium]
MSRKHMKTEEFNRIKVEDTKIINTEAMQDVQNSDYDEQELEKLSIDELKYILEYEQCDKKRTALIKKLIKQKR